MPDKNDNQKDPAIQKINALVVDDVAIMRKLLGLVLKNEGHNVVEAENGEQALSHLNMNPIDIVIADITMPDMDGLEMVEKIRSDDRTANIPVIMCTATKTPKDESRAKQLGIQGFLMKPIKPQTVKAKVNEILSGANAVY